MKKSAKLTLLLLSTALYIMIPVAASDISEGKYISLSLFRCSDDEIHYNPNLQSGRHRSNQRPLYGTISPDGVSIPGVETSDILYFEIYTPEGFCMGAFADEAEFIQTLFSLSGEYEIRLVTEEAVFVGVVEI